MCTHFTRTKNPNKKGNLASWNYTHFTRTKNPNVKGKLDSTSDRWKHGLEVSQHAYWDVSRPDHSSTSGRCEFINAGIWLVNMTLMNRVDQSQSGHRRRNGIVIPWSIQFEDLCRLKMLEMKKTSNARGTPMEDDLKILKVEYLSIHWSDFLQILNLSSGDHIKIKNVWNEDDLKILKIEYLSNHWPDLSQIWKLSSWNQTKIKNAKNINSWIAQQPLVRSSSYLNLKHRGPNQN